MAQIKILKTQKHQCAELNGPFFFTLGTIFPLSYKISLLNKNPLYVMMLHLTRDLCRHVGTATAKSPMTAHQRKLKFI
jgi:hypothetical protein